MHTTKHAAHKQQTTHFVCALPPFLFIHLFVSPHRDVATAAISRYTLSMHGLRGRNFCLLGLRIGQYFLQKWSGDFVEKCIVEPFLTLFWPRNGPF